MWRLCREVWGRRRTGWGGAGAGTARYKRQRQHMAPQGLKVLPRGRMATGRAWGGEGSEGMGEGASYSGGE